MLEDIEARNIKTKPRCDLLLSHIHSAMSPSVSGTRMVYLYLQVSQRGLTGFQSSPLGAETFDALSTLYVYCSHHVLPMPGDVPGLAGANRF